MRERIILACTECKNRNYTSTKEKKNTPNRVELKKYCKHCKTKIIKDKKIAYINVTKNYPYR